MKSIRLRHALMLLPITLMCNAAYAALLTDGNGENMGLRIGTLSERADMPPGVSSSSKRVSSVAASKKIPTDMEIYATQNVGSGQKCIVGAETDDDGMNEKPVVYLGDAKGNFAWSAFLPISTNTYQGRATHCIASDGSLFVLIQSDTQPQESLSQTLLQVVKLDRKSGSIVGSKSIDVPNISVPHTTWMEKGDGNFLAKGDNLIIRGRYEIMSDRDNSIQKDALHFLVNVSQSLKP